jgi:hypothetical protein
MVRFIIQYYKCTSIDVSNSGITNLSGIEYFALETKLQRNLLTTINLTNNTALKIFRLF